MQNSIDPILRQLKIQLTDLYRDRLDRIYLYGSRARKTADPDSDIDVLVVLKDQVDTNLERERTLDIVSQLSLEHDVIISCLFVDAGTYATYQDPLFRNIRREGVLI